MSTKSDSVTKQPRQADVIIVGGGIMGTSTAFFLRQRGLSVILIERDIVGRHASGTNFGNVRRQGRFLPQLPLANRSREIWGKLPELIGEDVEFLPSGHLRVAWRPEDVANVEQYARDCQHYGLELELLTANVLRDRYPYIGHEAMLGSLSPNDGHANPRLAAPAFARAARRAGAVIHEGVGVTGISKSGEDFIVATDMAGEFRAPIVQVSAGAWGDALAGQFGELAPLTPLGPQMGVTEPLAYAIGPSLGVSSRDSKEGIYLRQVKRGNIVFGGCLRGVADRETRLAKINPSVTLHQLGQLKRMVPALANAHVIRTWSGVEGYMPDDIPIMGPSGKVAGLFYAFGFCGHGFQLGPGVGDVMAELIATGQTSTPIDPFHISRFAGTSGSTSAPGQAH